VKVPD